MGEKIWRTCRLTFNGVSRKVRYCQDTIDFLFLPFLRRLSHIQQKERRRILVYLAGPPCTGKTTLARLLEKLSLTHAGLTPLQAVGMDGFRFHADALQTHYAEYDGERIPLSRVGNSPEVYDVEYLQEKLDAVRFQDVRWPVYDRALQDVVDDVVTIRKKILLLEGDWMLLREERWQGIRQYCDYSLKITADPKLIWEGLGTWKALDEKIPSKARLAYGNLHQRNVKRALQGSWAAHETWRLLSDGDYQMQTDAPRPRPMVNRQTIWQQPNVKTNDILLDSVGQRLAMLQAGGKERVSYEEGYSKGLSEARHSIIRRLYGNGSMTKEMLQHSFQISAEELESILENTK